MIKAETAYRVLWLDSYVLKEASINKRLLMLRPYGAIQICLLLLLLLYLQRGIS